MNYPASARPSRTNTPPRQANPAGPFAIVTCENVTDGDGTVCRSATNVRNVLMFPLTGEDPSPIWVCSTCEFDLNAAGHVVARVLSRRYNPTPEQLDQMRKVMTEQAELWTTGF